MSSPVAELRLFGQVSLRASGDGAPLPLRSRRGRGALAFAALQPAGAASRSRLAGLFWGDRGEAQARASVRQCLTELKLSLGTLSDAVLETSRDTLRLRLEAVRVDVLELERAMAARDPHALAALLEQIGGDVLMDEPAVSELHQDWIDQTRSHLERRLSACVQLLLKELREVDPALARRLADACLRRLPLDEEVVASAMRADVALGAAAAAVLRFTGLKAALARELKVAPSAAVQDALRLAMSASSPAAAVSATPVNAAAAPVVVIAAFDVPERAAGWFGALREEVLAGLSRFKDFSVVADARPMDSVQDEPWLRRDDAYLLSGAGQAQAGGVRFVVRLTRLQDRALVWSERAEGDAEAGEQVVDRIVARTVAAVGPIIQQDLVPRLSPAAGVHGRYLLARQRAASARTHAEAREAAVALEQLVAEVPSLPLTYLPLAKLYNTDFGFTRAGSSGPAERRRAFDLAKAALRLDRSHVHGYTVMGWCFLYDGNWEAAARHFDQAVELNPLNAERLMETGFGALLLGDMAAARARLERCLLIHPAPQDSFFTDLGLVELIAGRYDAAQGHFDMVADPTVFDALYSAANAVLAGAAAAGLAEAAWTRVRSIWPEDRPADCSGVAAWFDSYHPFRDTEARGRLNRAVDQALTLATR